MEGCEEEPLRLGSQEVNRGVHPLFGSKLEETGWTHSYQSPGGLALDSCGSHAVDLFSGCSEKLQPGGLFPVVRSETSSSIPSGPQFPYLSLGGRNFSPASINGFDGPQDDLFVQKGL